MLREQSLRSPGNQLGVHSRVQRKHYMSAFARTVSGTQSSHYPSTSLEGGDGRASKHQLPSWFLRVGWLGDGYVD